MDRRPNAPFSPLGGGREGGPRGVLERAPWAQDEDSPIEGNVRARLREFFIPVLPSKGQWRGGFSRNSCTTMRTPRNRRNGAWREPSHSLEPMTSQSSPDDRLWRKSPLVGARRHRRRKDEPDPSKADRFAKTKNWPPDSRRHAVDADGLAEHDRREPDWPCQPNVRFAPAVRCSSVLRARSARGSGRPRRTPPT